MLRAQDEDKEEREKWEEDACSAPILKPSRLLPSMIRGQNMSLLWGLKWKGNVLTETTAPREGGREGDRESAQYV